MASLARHTEPKTPRIMEDLDDFYNWGKRINFAVEKFLNKIYRI